MEAGIKENLGGFVKAAVILLINFFIVTLFVYARIFLQKSSTPKPPSNSIPSVDYNFADDGVLITPGEANHSDLVKILPTLIIIALLIFIVSIYCYFRIKKSIRDFYDAENRIITEQKPEKPNEGDDPPPEYPSPPSYFEVCKEKEAIKA